MKASTRFLVAAALAALLAFPAWADVRKGNIDVIIALDKSLSMVDKVKAVEDWVNTSIVDQLLIPGDYLVVVAFYGKADVVISQAIVGDTDKASIKRVISTIVGNGHFTDIGNALDVVKEQIAKRGNDSREKYVLLLTDGIQEAPPGSKYYSKDGSFNHEFLQNTKTIPEKGWKVMILGIGTGTAARDLAGELKGSYAEVSEKPTSTDIAATTGGIFSTITMAEPARVSPVRANGASSLTLSLKMSGPQGDASIVVSGISGRIGTRDVPALIRAPVTFKVRNNATTVISFPVSFPPDLPQGSGPGVLDFAFSSAATFIPASAAVTVTVNGPLQNTIQNNIPYIGAGALILIALIVLLLFLFRRLARGGPMRFAVVIEDEPVGEGPVTLPAGRELFLNEIAGAFSVVSKRNARSVVRFTAKGKRLVMTVLKQDRLPKLKEAPADARGRSFVLKSENGRNLSMKIQASERK